MPRLDEFEGDWSIERIVEDLFLGRHVEFTGIARLIPEKDGLLYREEGTLKVPGQAPIAASRSYHWRAEGNMIAVYFADARPFHRFDCDDPAPQASHSCDPDLYQVSYEFHHWPDWRSTWRALGPHKDYVLHNHFSRLSSNVAAQTQRTITAG